ESAAARTSPLAGRSRRLEGAVARVGTSGCPALADGPMHDTAYEIGGLFFQSYVNAERSVLEIGSLNINGGLRDFRPTAGSYIGVDLSPGNGVDVIVRRISQLPFRPE